MKLTKDKAEILIPDGTDVATALAQTTHLGIGAHQDDLELMAQHGILECFGIADKWFTGVTCTDGSGSPRAGVYANYTDDQMASVRIEEQRTAARIGRYSAMIQLGYPSKDIKQTGNAEIQSDLSTILAATCPKTLYLHNPADKHATHIATVIHAIRAIRKLPLDKRPDKIYGCEVWRSLDWVPDGIKVVLDVSGRDNLKAALAGVYDSQIAGGKRYDSASMGRSQANATYLNSHGVDKMESAVYAMDLTALIDNPSLSATDFTMDLIDQFRKDVIERIAALAE